MVYQTINEFVPAPSIYGSSVDDSPYEYISDLSDPYGSDGSSYYVGSYISDPCFSINQDFPDISCYRAQTVERPAFFLPCGCYSQMCKPGWIGLDPHNALGSSHCSALLAPNFQFGAQKPVVITLMDGVSVSFPLGFAIDDRNLWKINNLYQTLNAGELQPVIRNQRTTTSVGIDVIWKRHFQIIAPSFPDTWILKRISEMLDVPEAYRDTGNFFCRCFNCLHKWLDVEGTVIFYYVKDQFDTIKYFIKETQCPSCSYIVRYPDLYSSDAYSMINVLTNAIAFCVYGVVQEPTLPIPFGADLPLRHDASVCEGCLAAFCGPKVNLPTATEWI